MGVGARKRADPPAGAESAYLTDGLLPGCFTARGFPLRGDCGVVAGGVVAGGVVAGGVVAGGVVAGGVPGAGIVGTGFIDGGVTGAGIVGTGVIDGGMIGVFEIAGPDGAGVVVAGGVVMGRPCGAPVGL